MAKTTLDFNISSPSNTLPNLNKNHSKILQ